MNKHIYYKIRKDVSIISMTGNEFGFTNNIEIFNATRQYIKDAIDDGWKSKPTYKDMEDIMRAASLEKDGFKMMILARDDKDKNSKFYYQCSVNIWGPDGLCIRPPDIYNMQKIIKNSKRCNYCGKQSDKLQRVGFAGRSCPDCLDEQRKRQEFRGWTS